MTTFVNLNSPLGLRHLPLSYSDFTRLAYETYADPSTLVFLDTNVLALPFGFHTAARNGLYSLLREAVGTDRLIVPGWAANEFVNKAFAAGQGKHGFTGNVRVTAGVLPKGEHLAQLLMRSASADELTMLATSIGVPEAANVISRVTELARQWNEAMSLIGRDLNSDVIHEELSRELAGCVKSLDFEKHCARVDAHAAHRRAHRLPPGLSDGGKTQVGNVDGDLALWLEVLDLASQAAGVRDGRFSHVMVLTQERKLDFFYAPSTRLADAPRVVKPMANQQPPVQLIDPRLVSEFEARVGHRSLAFVDLTVLADGWQKASNGSDSGAEIRAFVRTLSQQADRDERRRVPETQAPTPTLAQAEGNAAVPMEAEQEAPANPPAQVMEILEAAFSDEKTYIAGIPEGPSKQLLNHLYSYNWYVQNPAVLELISAGLPADPDVSFVLGRAVYQAAHGNAWRAAAFLEGFHSWAQGFSQDLRAQAFVAGAAIEILFGPDGQLRERPKAGNLHEVFALLANPEWTLARNYVHDRLSATGRAFFWLPGTEVPQIALQIEGGILDPAVERYEARRVQLVVAGFQPCDLLRARLPLEPEPRSYDVDELRSKLARRLWIPETAIRVTLAPRGPEELQIEIEEGMTLDWDLAVPQQIEP